MGLVVRRASLTWGIMADCDSSPLLGFCLGIPDSVSQ